MHFFVYKASHVPEKKKDSQEKRTASLKVKSDCLFPPGTALLP